MVTIKRCTSVTYEVECPRCNGMLSTESRACDFTRIKRGESAIYCPACERPVVVFDKDIRRIVTYHEPKKD